MEDKQKRKEERRANVAKGTAPAVWEYVLCVLLILESIALIVCQFMDKVSMMWVIALDILVSVAVIFKGFIFTHLTWQSFFARRDNFDVKNLCPPPYYKYGQKIALAIWTFCSTWFCVYALGAVLGMGI